jgi:GNAT superfamily N-acetyltransferase
MKYVNQVKVEIVKSWEEGAIVDLYRAGGWWKEDMDPTRLGELIEGSFLFAVAIDIADAYVQDLVVLEGWKVMGVGKMILSRLLEECTSHKITWIGLIAEPGTESFYRSLGFVPMEGHVPMLFSPETK